MSQVSVTVVEDNVQVVLSDSGPQGIQGPQGPTGATGPQGATGATGATGSAGIGYDNVTSTSTITIGSGIKTFTLVSSYAGAFTSGSRIRAIHSDTPTYWMEGYANYVGGGTLILSVDKFNGSGSHNLWRFSIAGEVGNTGATGATGAQGPSGVIEVTAPITNTGTSTSAQLGIDQSGLTLAQSQVTGLVSDLAAKAPLASPTFTGTVTAPLTAGFVKSSSGGVLSSSTIAESDVTNLVSDLAAKLAIQAQKDYEGTPAGVIDTVPRYSTATLTLTSGVQYFTFFTPRTDMTVTNLSMACQTVGTSVTSAFMGIYSYDGTTVTLLNSISDSAMFNAVGAVTKTIPPTSLSAGQRYAFSVLTVATTGPTVARTAVEATAASFFTPRITGQISSRTTLIGSQSFPIGQPTPPVANTASAIWARLS
jgi:hypothetical protein